jgi:hypothetical protein
MAAVADIGADTLAVHEVKIYGHSPIVFWWPGWVVAFVLAFMTSMMGVPVSIGQGESELVLPQSTPHVVFTVTIILLILFTNVKMRGIYSIFCSRT